MMSVIQEIRSNLLWAEGRTLVILSGIITVVLYCISSWLLLFPISFLAFSFYFFRNPQRYCPESAQDSAILIAPADGKIVSIERSSNSSFNGFDQRVSIFLSPIDVHVNWIPMTGSIKKIIYKSGAFGVAFAPKSSELNERNDLLVTNSQGQSIIIRQIAGTVARRIVCWVHEGQEVTVGQKYGMIKFGSRVDLLLPKTVVLSIQIGQRVYGGQSILGRWLCSYS